jgi:hypothetical protein
MPRETHQVETRLIAEYCQERYAKFPVTLGQPLGLVKRELIQEVGLRQAINLTRPFRPEVDAIVVLPRFLLLVEAKVWNVVNGLAKLPLYKSLVPVTEEFKRFTVWRGTTLPDGRVIQTAEDVDLTQRPVLMQLVVGWTNDNLEIMARDAGVEVVVFHRPWLDEVVKRMHHYWTAEYRQAREEKMRLRRAAGVE